jgi:hypothetical protein
VSKTAFVCWIHHCRSTLRNQTSRLTCFVVVLKILITEMKNDYGDLWSCRNPLAYSYKRSEHFMRRVAVLVLTALDFYPDQLNVWDCIWRNIFTLKSWKG